MKQTFAAVLVCCLIVSALSAPPKITFKDVNTHVRNQQGHGRFKRLTCDVLSIEVKGVKLDDAACAAHCAYIGQSGVTCDDRKVCRCRN